MTDVLLVDDEPSILEALSGLLKRSGRSVSTANGPGEARDRLSRDPVRCVLMDLRMPGVEGFEFLDEVRSKDPRIPVIMMTAHGTVRNAVEAVKRGAFDFVTKPLDRDELLTALDKALRLSDAEASTSSFYFELPRDTRVVFQDSRSRALLEKLRKAAGTNLPVLITGETGVGKEVFARLLHELSPRRRGPFVKVNCAALPQGLFESELFGHERGAFTGAVVSKPGRIEIAGGGTLLLDEIGELEKPAQAKLLQFLQDRTFERVGGLRTLKADVRVVAATNRELKEALREDLYFRLNAIPLPVPPLRERPGDIDSLVRSVLQRTSRPLALAPGAMDALRSYPWPGNVRELELRLERAAALADGDVLGAADILDAGGEGRAAEGTDLRDERKAFERRRIREVLRACDGNRTRAAEKLGISRRMLQKKLKDLDLGQAPSGPI